MAEETHQPKRRNFGLRDVPGTTVALTSLAVLGAAAVVSAPLWLWYRRKRKRTDAMVREAGRRDDTARPGTADEAARPESPETSPGTSDDSIR